MKSWTAVYATNGAIQTSDARLKTDVKQLDYGLAEIMSLKPASFRWTDQPSGDVHLGLDAQEAETIIPEVVVPPSKIENPLKRPDSQDAHGF